MSRKLPPQVQRKLEEADALEAQLQEPAPPEVPAEPQAPEVPEPPAPPEPPQPEPDPPVQPEPPQEQLWEQRYKTLKGMFDKTVPQLQKELDDLKVQLKQKQELPPPPPPTVQVSQTDIETYGPELIDLIRRAAREEVDAAAGPLREATSRQQRELESIQNTTTTVATRVAESGQQAYFAALAERVPDWEDINVNPGFLAWLAEPDPVFGLERQGALTVAFEALDVPRTVALFNGWKAEAGLLNPPQQPAPVPSPSAELEKQVSPGNAKSSAPTPQSAQPKVWSSREIDTWYKDRARGALRHLTAADIAKTEAEIDLAVSQGRVRP